MTVTRDPDAILAAWLEEGPQVLPEVTRRSIAVSVRTTDQSRHPHWLPWRAPNMNGMTRFALAALAVAAVAVGGLFLLRPGTESGGVGGPASSAPSMSPVPSASPAPSAAGPAASIPAMTQLFTSARLGYSIRYPADWVATSGEGSETFDAPALSASFRVLSAVVPDGVAADDYIVGTLTTDPIAACSPRPDTLPVVTIDGQEGRLRGFCGEPPATEIEASVVIGKRVYLFTLFWYAKSPPANEAEVRALFDAFTSTITLDPPEAAGSPNPSPS